MTREIPIGGSSKVALVDACDFERLSKRKWRIAGKSDTIRGSVGGKTVTMARCIMNAPPGFDVDHRNHDRFDNRRCNLRVVTRQQNIFNRGKSRTGSSQFKGTSWDKKSHSWRVQIRVDGTTYRLGNFDDEIDAALVYDMAARFHFGEFAFVNFDRMEMLSAPAIRQWYLESGKKSRCPLLELLSMAYCGSIMYDASLVLEGLSLPVREREEVFRGAL